MYLKQKYRIFKFTLNHKKKKINYDQNIKFFNFF